MTQPKTKIQFSIHPQTDMGHVSLTVAGLENQIAFYQQAMGFKLHWRDGNQAGLGAGGADLLKLTQEPNRKKYRGVTGLYHVAYLFPNRRQLAIAMARLFTLKYPNAPTDHIMTKTTYLDDLEGNGIELYCESPEDGTWTMGDGKFDTRRTDGSLSNGREALDVDDLFTYMQENEDLTAPVPTELKIGHVHLHVRDVQEAIDFYHGILGFDLMGFATRFQMGFVSAGGYHHHLGLNTWQGEGAPPPPSDAVGLRHYSIQLPNQQALDEVIAHVDAAHILSNQTTDGLLIQDPSMNNIILAVARSPSAPKAS